MADRVERLTNLLALLLETREPLTLDVIAAELGGQYPDGHDARRASFERDKAALRDIGIEISSETLTGDRGNFDVLHLAAGQLAVTGHEVLVCTTRDTLESRPLPKELVEILQPYCMTVEEARAQLVAQ